MGLPPIAAFAICSFIWGTTWLAIKIGYSGLDAVWGASLRFFLAGVLLIPLILRRRLRLPPGRRPVLVVLFVGVVLFGLDYGLIYWGEQFIPSGITAILAATTPLFTALLSVGLLRGEPMRPAQVFGIVGGFLGVVLLYVEDLDLSTARLGPVLAILGAAAAAACSSIAVRRWGRDIAPPVLTAGATLVGAIALLGASLALGETPSLPRTTSSALALGYLAVFGSVVGFLLYWQLLQAWPAHRAILVTLLTPVVAVLTGLLVDERLGVLEWTGAAVVLAGAALSVTPGRAVPRAPTIVAPAKAEPPL